MGGRLALSFAINHQNKIRGLILESSSPGIENENIRKERVKNDLFIAEQIQNNELKDFFTEWYKQPVFSSLRNIPNKLESLIERKTGNNKIGLINSLKGFSTGKMKSYWNDISKMEIPVLLVCGSLDAKYCEIMQKMNLLIPNSTLKVNVGTGHITHLEKPDEFLNFVRSFLRTFLN
jgi:2-succinyl-6-hydroxy-2,4-cyclohexadiene-1-carboxylate synthase